MSETAASRMFDGLEAMPGVYIAEIEAGTREEQRVFFTNPSRHIAIDMTITRLPGDYVDRFMESWNSDSLRNPQE